MRFVELRPDPDRDGFELNRRITVLRGLAPADRVAIVGFLHSVAVGDTFGWTGQVEIHGIVMPLRRALEFVGETAEAALIIEANKLLDIAADPEGINNENGEAYREAVSAREEIDAMIADLAEELSGADRIRSQMTGRLASITARIDRDAGARLDRVDGLLGRAA